MDWLIEVVVTVIPDWLGGMLGPLGAGVADTIEVLVTAVPAGFGPVVTGGALVGAVGFILIFGLDHLASGGKL